MVDFSNISSLEPKTGRTVEYRLREITGVPVLLVAPALDINTEYFKALIERNNGRAVRSNSEMSIEQLKEIWDRDRELYARFIVKGWKGLVDRNGAVVEFNYENALALMKALPQPMFNDLRVFCSTFANFIEQTDAGK